MVNSMEIPLKTKNKATIWPWNPTMGYILEIIIIQEDTYTPMFIAALFTPGTPWTLLGLQRDQISQFKGNQSWIFIGRTDAEAEAPILWPSDGKSQLLGKDTDAGKDEKQKRAAEDEMVRYHYQLNGHESGSWMWIWEIVKDKEDWHALVPGVAMSQTWLSDWTTTTPMFLAVLFTTEVIEAI